jgi:hypothetical protein
MTEQERKALEDLAARVKRTRGGQCVETVRGWKFVMDREAMGSIGTHLSASLYPMGRSSTEEDWQFLGGATAVLGAPEDALLTPMETTHPNAVYHWHWNAPPDVIARFRAVYARLAAARKAAASS